MKNIQWSLLLLLLLPGCSSTKIRSTWKAKDAGLKSYSKILVLGLIREADRGLQENMEDHLAGDLDGLGYIAVSALKEYGPKGFEKMDEQTALVKLRNRGIDAVITIVLLDKERERRYVPSPDIYSSYGYSQRSFWDYYGTMYQRIYEAGYFVTDTRYFWESNLYDMSDQHLLYSVQTQSFDPANSGSLGHEYGRLIVKNMVKNNVLVKNAAYLPEKAF